MSRERRRSNPALPTAAVSSAALTSSSPAIGDGVRLVSSTSALTNVRLANSFSTPNLGNLASSSLSMATICGNGGVRNVASSPSSTSFNNSGTTGDPLWDGTNNGVDDEGCGGVRNWLESVGRGFGANYGRRFEEEEVTLKVLWTLTDSDLRELGVTKMGHRKLISIAAERLRPSDSKLGSVSSPYCSCSRKERDRDRDRERERERERDRDRDKEESRGRDSERSSEPPANLKHHHHHSSYPSGSVHSSSRSSPPRRTGPLFQPLDDSFPQVVAPTPQQPMLTLTLPASPTSCTTPQAPQSPATLVLNPLSTAIQSDQGSSAVSDSTAPAPSPTHSPASSPRTIPSPAPITVSSSSPHLMPGPGTPTTRPRRSSHTIAPSPISVTSTPNSNSTPVISTSVVPSTTPPPSPQGSSSSSDHSYYGMLRSSPYPAYNEDEQNELANSSDKLKISMLAMSDVFIQGVELCGQLGEGSFGVVWRGLWKGIQVAVKRAKDCTPREGDEADCFMQEAAVLKRMRHPNVVSFYGIWSNEEVPHLVCEFMSAGSLDKYLEKNNVKIPTSQLLKFAQQTALGMIYLESCNVIHRDLAARNVLLKPSSDGLVACVGDFGLSRILSDASEQYNSSSNVMPIRWAAPESLMSRIFSSKSDVWSFGVVMWEIFSLGAVPYSELANTGVLSHIKKGNRLPIPINCPESLFKVMLNCWKENPEERPTFEEINNQLLKTHTATIKVWFLHCEQCFHSTACKHRAIPWFEQGCVLVPSTAEVPATTRNPTTTTPPTPLHRSAGFVETQDGRIFGVPTAWPSGLPSLLCTSVELACVLWVQQRVMQISCSHFKEDGSYTIEFDVHDRLVLASAPKRDLNEVQDSLGFCIPGVNLLPVNLSLFAVFPGNLPDIYRYGACCDICSQSIPMSSSWQHCTDPACTNFDMCTSCYAASVKDGKEVIKGTHLASHQMLKAFGNVEVPIVPETVCTPSMWIPGDAQVSPSGASAGAHVMAVVSRDPFVVLRGIVSPIQVTRNLTPFTRQLPPITPSPTPGPGPNTPPSTPPSSASSTSPPQPQQPPAAVPQPSSARSGTPRGGAGGGNAQPPATTTAALSAAEAAASALASASHSKVIETGTVKEMVSVLALHLVKIDITISRDRLHAVLRDARTKRKGILTSLRKFFV
ncbi:Src tyrosine kinase 2 [Pelomyxa schiedti]|nr:Src tyrosine kinase 2 [Pelomyxa schiedti]